MEELQIIVNASNGEIDCNFEEAKIYLTNQLEEYRTAIFTDVSIKPAEAVVADLRKQKKAFEDRVKEVKKAYMAPFEEFKSKADELIRLYDEPIEFINGQVQDYKRRRKEEKKAAITDIYQSIFEELAELVPIEKIYNQRWENATYKMRDVEKDLRNAAAKITAELNVLYQSPSAFAAKAREIYLNNSFNLNEALTRLQEYENARQEEIKREQEREMQRQIEEAKKAERERILAEQAAEEAKQQAVEEAKEEAIAAYIPDQTGEEATAVLYSVNVTPAEKEALEMYMNSVGIDFTEV